MWQLSSITSLDLLATCEQSKQPEPLATKEPTRSGQPGSTESSGPSKKSRDPDLPTMPKGRTPMLRMSWRAMSPSSASTMAANMADMMRGAVLEAPLHPCWIPYWTVWQGASELRPSPSSMRYGVTLWLELASPELESS